MVSTHRKLKPIHIFSVAIAFGLTLLCSCATPNPNHSQLPADVTMNKDAGRGDFITIMLRLENGEEVPMLLDTGASITLFDKSLDLQLGQKTGDINLGNPQHWGQAIRSDQYPSPKLYLGDVLLEASGSNTATMDLSKMSLEAASPIKGVLGMNILKHYCIQLDFDAGRVRFLEDETTDKKDWGKAFPILANGADTRPFLGQNLLGAQGAYSLIDSGYASYGWLRPMFFQQWTNPALLLAMGEVHSPYGMFDGEKYPDVSLDVQSVNDADGIGLSFLARHLVTLDFPKHTLYLKRISAARLASKDREAAPRLAVQSAMKYLAQLRNQNRLPGVSTSDAGQLTDLHFYYDDSAHLDSVTFDGQKKGDPSFYHYTVTRTARNDPWELQKAWRADAQDHVLKEYPVP